MLVQLWLMGKFNFKRWALRDSVGVKNHYRYRAYKYDTETGLYYLQSRCYTSEWWRFINANSEGGTVRELLSYNVFAYFSNNFINRSNLEGQAWWAIGAVAGAAVGGAAAGALAGAGLGYITRATFSAITTAAVAIKTSEIVKTSVSKAQQVVSRSLNIEKVINFASATAKHMDNSKRHVPVQILREAIKSGISAADPRGSDDMMYYTTMYRNGSNYNLEVLYHKVSNTKYRFEYARKAMGPLVEIFKK